MARPQAASDLAQLCSEAWVKAAAKGQGKGDDGSSEEEEESEEEVNRDQSISRDIAVGRSEQRES